MSEEVQYALIPYQQGVGVSGIQSDVLVGRVNEFEKKENVMTINFEADGEEYTRHYRPEDFVAYDWDAYDLVEIEEELEEGQHDLEEITPTASLRDDGLEDPEVLENEENQKVVADGGRISSFRFLEEDPKALESYSDGYEVRFHKADGYTVVTGPRDELSHFFQDERQNLGREADEGEFFQETSYESKDELRGQMLEEDDFMATPH
jgi:hypothetical protein